MDKHPSYKVGAVNLAVIISLVIIIFILLPAILSKPLLKSEYTLGEKIKVDLPGNNVKIQIVTPTASYLRESSGSFLFQPTEAGDYQLIFGGEVYNFQVVDNSSLEAMQKTSTRNSSSGEVTVSEGLSNKPPVLSQDNFSGQAFSVSQNADFVIRKKNSTSLFSSLVSSVEPSPHVNVYNSLGETVPVNVTMNETSAEISISIEKPRDFVPGKYTLTVESWSGSYNESFLWGLISLNTMKSTYSPGEDANFEVVVLDSSGRGVCGANVNLYVTNPSGKQSELKGISGNNMDCGLYHATYPVGSQGVYNVSVGTIVDGKKLDFNTSFLSEVNPLYEVIRHTASKIHPTRQKEFPVTIEVKSLSSKGMNITEYVPSSFNISNTNAKIISEGNTKELIWKINGTDANLSYDYSVPPVYPYLYELGPLNVNNYSEFRPWYVAVDPSTTVGGFCTGIITCESYGSATTCTCSEINAIDGTYLGTRLNARTRSGGGALAIVNFSNSSLVPPGAVISSATLNVNYYVGGTTATGCTVSYSTDSMSSWNTVNPDCTAHTTQVTDTYDLSNLTSAELDSFILNLTLDPPSRQFSTAYLYFDYANITVTYLTEGAIGVTLVSPGNGNSTSASNVSFDYIPSSSGNLQNCTLYVKTTNGTSGQGVWLDSNLQYCRNITISNSGSSLTNFPSYINVTNLTGMNPDLSDLKFSSSSCGNGGNSLPYYLESHDSNHANAWVLTNLSTGSNVISLYYGNSTPVSSSQNESAVFGNDYIGVWNLENSSGSLGTNDVSPNQNNGTNSGATLTTGKIDGGGSFNGASSFVNLPNSFISTNNFTVSTWFKTTSDGVLFSEQNAQTTGTPGSYDPLLYVESTGLLHGGIYTGSIPSLATSSAVNDGNWHKATLTVSSGSQSLYLDGAFVGTASGTPEGPFTYWYMGTGYTNTWPNSNNAWFYYNGAMDQVEVRSGIESSSWINQSYNLEGNQGSFVSISAPQGYTSSNNTNAYNSTFSPIATDFSPVNGTDNYFTEPFTSGTYLWNVQCWDFPNGPAFGLENYTLIVDNTPPSVSLLSPSDGASSTSGFGTDFTYSVTDNFDSISNCSLMINGSAYETNSSVTTGTTQTFSEYLPNGFYTWSVRCYDAAGNVDEPASRTIYVNAPSNALSSTLYETSTSSYTSTASIFLNNSSDATENNVQVSIPNNGLYELSEATSAYVGGKGAVLSAGTINFDSVVQASSASFSGYIYLTWKAYITNSTGDYLLCESGNDNTGGTQVTSTSKSTWTGSCTLSSDVTLKSTDRIKLVLDAYNTAFFGGGSTITVTHYWDSSDNSYVNFAGGFNSIGDIQTDLSVPNHDLTINSGQPFNMTCSANCTTGICPSTEVYSQYSTGTTSSWYDSNWAKRKLITIPSGKVTQDLSNFPVLINITDADLHTYALSSGNDILFTDYSGNLLPYQIEYFNKSYTPSTAYLVAWVKMNLSASSSNYIWMYYNDSAATSHANPSAVWSNGYQAVYHMNQANSVDSLGLHNATSVGGVSSTSGLIDGSDSFSGSDYLNTTYLQNAVTQYTISAWVKTTASQGVLVQDRGSGAGQSVTLAIGPSCGPAGSYCSGAYAGVPSVGVDSNAVWQGVGGSSGQTVNNGAWHYVVGVFNSTSGQTVSSSNFKIYIDGVDSSSSNEAVSGSPTSPLTGLSGTQIGHHSAWNIFYTGQMDEVRMSDISRSPSWINATYQNEADPSSFYSVGSQETLGSSGLLWANVSGSGNIILDNGETNGHSLGDITSPTSTTFSLVAGSSSSYIRCYATSSGSSYVGPTTRQISVSADTIPPNVTLVSPANDSSADSSFGVNFVFNATDNSFVSNCSLLIDGSVAYTNSSIVNGADTTANLYVSSGVHNWSVRCYDASGNLNQSETRLVNVTSSASNFGSTWYETGTSSYTPPANIYLNYTRDATENNAAISLPGNSLVNIVNATSPYMGNNGAIIPAGTISFSAVAQASNSNFRAEAYLTWKLYKLSSSGSETLICQAGDDSNGGTAVSSTSKSTWTGSCTNPSEVHLGVQDRIKLVIDAYNYARFGGGQTMTLTHYWDSSDNSYVNIAGFNALGDLSVDLTQPVVNQNLASGQDFNATCSINCSVGICQNTVSYVQYNTSTSGWTDIGSSGNVILAAGETNGHSAGNVTNSGNTTIFSLVGVSSVSNIRCRASSDYSSATGPTTRQINISADTIPPEVNLISPANSTNINSNYGVNFVFNATDNNRVANCSLMIDGNRVYTNYSIIQGVSTTVNRYLSPGLHNWSVNCYDFAGNLNQTQTRTVNVSIPYMTFLPLFYETSTSNYASTAEINLSNVRDATENNVAVSVPSGSVYELADALSPYMGNNGAELGAGTISFSAVASVSSRNYIYLTWKVYISNSTGDHLVCQSGNDGTGGTRITSTGKSTWTGSCNNPSAIYLGPDDQVKLILDAYNARTSAVTVTHYWDNLDLSDLQFNSFSSIGNVSTDLTYPTSNLYNLNTGQQFNVTCQVSCSAGTCYNTNVYVQYNLTSASWISVGSSGNIILAPGETDPHNLGNLGAGTTSTNFTLEGHIASINNVRCMVSSAHSSGISPTTRIVALVNGAEAPTVTLSTPDNTWFNTTNPVLYYTPSDANDNLANSSLILNGVLDLTNQSPLINVGTNNFTLSGLAQGYYNWSVNVTDTTNLHGNSSTRTFIVDTQSPSVSLSYPANNSALYSSNVNFGFAATDNLAPTMTCSLFINGTKEGSSFSVSNGTLGSYSGIWWNSSWANRQEINLSVPSGSTPSGYQQEIILNASNVGSGFNWSTECVNSNSSRIRFLNSYQNVTLPYWIQSCSVSGENLTAWVKLDKPVNTTGYLIYLYYGNPSASVYSNGAATFDYFDTGNLASSWTIAGASGQTSAQGDPVPSYYAVSQNGNYMYKNINLQPNETLNFNGMSNGLGDLFFLASSSGSGQMFRLETRGGQHSGMAASSSWTSWSAPSACSNVATNTWYDLQIKLGSTTAQSYINGVSCGGAYTFANNGGYIGLVGDALGSGYTTWWDNLFVTTTSSVVPTYDVGSQESGPFNVANKEVTGLSRGNYFWNVLCTDLAGNTNVSETGYFSIASLAPHIVLLTPNSTSSNTGNITLTYNLTGSSGVNYSELILNGSVNQLNQTAVIEGENTFNLTNLAQGYYTWSVNATNAFGLTGASPEGTFIVDETPPTVTSGLPANNSFFNTSSINFNFTATDNLYSNLTCNLTVGSYTDSDFQVSSGVLTNRLETGLPNGFTQWFVECSDGAGNVGYSELRNINISAKPVVNLVTNNNTYFNSSSVTLFYNASSTTGLASCGLYLNGTLSQASNSINNGLNNFTATGLSQGYYNWSIYCTDTSGASTQTPTRIFGVDLSPPSILLYLPPYNSTLSQQSVNFTFSVSDSFDPVPYCNLSVNGVVEDSNFSVQSGQNTTKTLNFTSGGDEYWDVTCWDWADNTNTSSLGYFALSFPPAVNLTRPYNGEWLNLSNILLSYNVSDVTNSLVNSSLYLDDTFYESNQTSLINDVVNNFSLTSLSDGHYNWSVQAFNALGLSTKTNDSTFTVDTVPPSVSINGPNGTGVVTSNNVTFNFTATDNLANPLKCNLTLDGFLQFENFNAQNASDTLKYYPVHNGNHSWYVRCADPAGNSFTTSEINFTVKGHPLITLNSPANNNITKYSTIQFGYTPYDVFGITQCGLYLDGSLTNSSTSILNGQPNYFLTSGISQGFYNWTVNCTSSDGVSSEPSAFNFTVDQTPPVITLDYPLNNSGVYYGSGTLVFKWTASDPYDPFLNCDLYVDGVQKVSNYLVSSGVPATRPVSLASGEHAWNATCTDQVGNTNSSLTYDFNFTYPDFVVNASSIKFNVTSPEENQAVGVNVTTYNVGGASIHSVVVDLYNGTPSSGNLIGTSTISISAHGSNLSRFVWKAAIGTTQIYAVADPSNTYTELNKSNNQWSENITVGSWQYLYGFISPSSNYTLSNNANSSLEVWPASLFNGGNIFVTNSQSSISWPSLLALGRTTSGSVATPNDFQDADTLLGMANYKDSIYNIYTNGTGTPLNTTSFLIYNASITNVPVVDSINNSNFTTGILWDSSPPPSGNDTDGQFDVNDRENLVFVSKIHPNTKGTYGTYDYEMRVPAKLRDYSPTPSTASIYVELE